QAQYAVAAQTAIISVLSLAIASVIVLFFVRKRPALGCAVIFIGFCILFMSAYNSLAVVKGKSYYTKQFAENAASQIRQSDDLVAYKDVSSGFVHYFGKVVPVVEDVSQTFDKYRQGAWVVATGRFMDELLRDGRFVIGWQCTDALMDEDKTVAGALFHRPTGPRRLPGQ
ncbi:MAG: hypothetical protein ACYST2_04880, partial [Planctomycetota bacterium]